MMRFSEKAWLTPNTYCGNFASLPGTPGIYLIVAGDSDIRKQTTVYRVVYVGKSQNIAKRISGHPVLAQADKDSRRVKESRLACSPLSLALPFVRVYFKQFAGDLDRIERNLIRLFDPRYNVRDRPQEAMYAH